MAERFGVQSQIRDATLYNQWQVVGNQFQRITLTAGETYPVFSDNKISASMLDPVGQSLLKYFPKLGDYFLADGNLANYVLPSFIKNLEHRLTIRIDR